MNNSNYKQVLNDIKSVLEYVVQPIQYIDISKMSKKEKDNLIIELQNKIHSLESELLVRKSVYDRYTNGLIKSKYEEMIRLLNNPILTLPSGKKIQFNELSSEQLEYLESLSIIQKKINTVINNLQNLRIDK